MPVLYHTHKFTHTYTRMCTYKCCPVLAKLKRLWAPPSMRLPQFLKPLAVKRVPQTTLSFNNLLEEPTELTETVFLTAMVYYREEADEHQPRKEVPRQSPRGSEHTAPTACSPRHNCEAIRETTNPQGQTPWQEPVGRFRAMEKAEDLTEEKQERERPRNKWEEEINSLHIWGFR